MFECPYILGQAMKITKRILFSRRLHEIVVIRASERVKIHCEQCLAEEVFMSLDTAVNLLRIGTRQILARIETGEIHTAETLNGQLLVCVRSLAIPTDEPLSVGMTVTQ
jgi:hypothetical protein